MSKNPLLIFLALLALALISATAVIAFQVGWRGTRGWLISWTPPVVALVLAAVLLYCALPWLVGTSRAPTSAPKGTQKSTEADTQKGTQQGTEADTQKTHLEHLESVAKIIAFIAAALFILVKLAAGHGFSNAAIVTTTDRSSIGPERDLVAVTTRVTSAGARSFQILDVKMFEVGAAQGTALGSELRVTGFKKHCEVDSGISSDETDRPLTLHPGDSIEVVGWSYAKPKQALPVKVVVLGLSSTALATEQWVSAAISLPLEPKPPKETENFEAKNRPHNPGAPPDG